MINLPYLISLASYTSGVDRYLDSLKNLGNSAEWIPVVFDSATWPHHLAETPSYRIDTPYPGHLYRFEYIPQDLDPDRWWIFTDTADVIFQKPIPDLDGLGIEIWTAPESETHRNNGIWKGIIGQFPQAEKLLDTPIYNMGTWAMRGQKALELVQYLQDNRASFNCHPNSDQLMYNLWLTEQPTEIVGVHPTLMVCLYANLEKGFVRKENGVFVNEAGQPFAITHANGNQKEWLA